MQRGAQAGRPLRVPRQWPRLRRYAARHAGWQGTGGRGAAAMGASGFHVGVGINVEELQEQAEVHRIAFVGGRSEQQDVIGAIAKQFAQAP